MSMLSLTDCASNIKTFLGGKSVANLVVLGTGWNDVLKKVSIEKEISYQDIFGVSAGVSGHAGTLYLSGNTLFMGGRFHLYEGYSPQEVVRPIEAMAQNGVSRLIITAAVGGLAPRLDVGNIVVLNDVLTLLVPSPLVGPQFIDMSEPFSPQLRAIAHEVGAQAQAPMADGAYGGVRGPHFETFADKEMLRLLGADVVGMSTVVETIMARSLGLEVLGLSLVTNLAFVKHEHKDVLAAAQSQGEVLGNLLNGILARL